MKVDRGVVCFISNAKIPANNPVADIHESVAIGLFVNYYTGEIVDVSSVFLSDIVREFLKSLLIHRNIHVESLDDLIWSVQEYLNCATQKAVCVCIKKNITEYAKWRKARGMDYGFASWIDN